MWKDGLNKRSNLMLYFLIVSTVYPHLENTPRPSQSAWDHCEEGKRTILQKLERKQQQNKDGKQLRMQSLALEYFLSSLNEI